MYFQYEILIFKRTKSKEKGLILKQANKQTKKNNNKKKIWKMHMIRRNHILEWNLSVYFW